MRKPRLNLSARQTIAFGIFGAVVAASGFILPIHHRNAHDSPVWLLATMLALLVAGFALSVYATSDLESGLLNERWPEVEILSARALLASSFFTAATVLCLLAAIVFMLISRSARPVGWALLIFGQSLQRLQTAARPPRPTRPAVSFTPTWQNFSPIRSDHWGER